MEALLAGLLCACALAGIFGGAFKPIRSLPSLDASNPSPKRGAWDLLHHRPTLQLFEHRSKALAGVN